MHRFHEEEKYMSIKAWGGGLAEMSDKNVIFFWTAPLFLVVSLLELLAKYFFLQILD